MSLLDKFNNWYVRVIPESETGLVITWLEPEAGARHRWKVNRNRQLYWLPVMFVLILIMPSKRRGYDDYSLEFRFWFAVGMTALFGIAGWFFQGARQMITLSTQRLIIGQGRGQRRIHLDETPLTLETRDGYTVLLLRPSGKEPERIYVATEKEVEVRDLLTKAGWLKS